MKVKCSGELFDEPIDTEECLQCALKHGTPPCGYGYRLLKQIFSGQEDRSEEIHVTDLTGCLLKSYYDKTAPKPPFVHDMVVMWMGRVLHDALDFDDEYVISEQPVEKDGLQGRVDAIIGQDIWDTKTTRWMKPSLLPYGSHGDQVNIYRHLVGGDGELFIQYIDVSGPTKCRKHKRTMQMIDGVVQCPVCGIAPKDAHLGAQIVQIHAADPEDVETFVKERVETLRDALDVGIEPDPEPGFLCNYCPHVECPFNPQRES